MPRNKLDWSLQYIIKVWETYSSIMFSEPCWQIIGKATFFTILQLVGLLCWTVPEESFESWELWYFNLQYNWIMQTMNLHHPHL